MFDFYGKLKFLEKPVEELEAKPVEKGKILFYGHSLFTRWSAAYGNRELSEVIVSFNALLRASINVTREYTTVSEEFEYVRQYMRIQQHRYADETKGFA